MPRLIEEDGGEAIELDELVERLEARGFDAEDEEAMASFGAALGRLGRNRRFLGDLVIEELRQSCAGQVARNQYGAQVILLRASRSYLIRANFWPAEEDSVVVNSGRDPFFYGVPHDHNFSFLTVGYLGPGYWSDYYEYEYDRVLGYPGENVDLRFVERSRLSEGKIMLYRRHRDVHSQLPPDSLSVSINILALSPANEFRDQYRFDLERREVTGTINTSSLETLVRLAGRFGGGNGAELVDHCAARHPSDRIRFAALQAQVSAETDLDVRIDHFDRAARATSGLVSRLAAGEAERLRKTRRWFEQAEEVSSAA